MTSLSLILALAIILTFLLFAVVNLGERTSTEAISKVLFIGYAWAMFLLLGYGVCVFIGLGQQGTPQLATDKQLRMQYLGYYVGSRNDSRLLLMGKAQGNALEHPALGEDEMISLEPVWGVGTNQPPVWKLGYKAQAFPLRINGLCVNIPADFWLNSDDSVIAYLKTTRGTKFFAVRWRATKGMLGGTRNYFYYSQGAVENGELRYELRDTLLSDRLLEEGRKLSVMMQLAPEPFKKVLAGLDHTWWEAFEGLTWIRERRGIKDSRIGILVDDSLFKRTDLRLTKNATQLLRDDVTQDQMVPSRSVVSYGLGYQNSLSLRLPEELSSDPVWGNVFEFRFVEPESWALPPDPTAPFILTSSRDYIPLDGYYINIGETPHPFYAKAVLEASQSTLAINDGTRKQAYGRGDPIRLGDYQIGVTLSLNQVQSPIKYTGRWALGFLFAGTIFFTWLTRSETPGRLKADFAWTSIWGLIQTILFVRLVLAYRVALLPPDNATPKQIQNVFDKALETSLWGGLLVVPLLLLFCRFLTRPTVWDKISASLTAAGIYKHLCSPLLRTQLFAESKRIYSLHQLTIVWMIPCIWIVLGKLFGHTESLFGMRINSITLALSVFALAISTKRVIEMDRRKDRVATLIYLALVLLLMIAMIKDNGYIIYGISFTVYAVLVLLWDRQKASVGTKSMLAYIALLTLIFLSPPLLVKAHWLKRIIYPVIPENVFYRVVSNTETENLVLLERAEEGNISMDLLLRNSHQNWQMLLYAGEGIREPRGYCQSPISDRGMTYPTMMADCVFSTFVVSEHGLWAGAMLVLLYVAIGFFCFYGSWYFPDTHQYRSLVLVVIGSIFSCTALYMMAANVGLVPFTGQNIPLLGLYSYSDLLQGAALATFIAFLLRADLHTSRYNRLAGQRAVRRAEMLLLAGLGMCALLIVGRMHRLGQDAHFTNDINFSPEIFESLQSNLPSVDEPEKNTALILAGDSLVKQPGVHMSEIAEQIVNQFNERPNKYDENGGVIYLSNVQTMNGEERAPRINENYFKMRSPFRRSSLWRGLITARSGENNATISALGHSFTISLAKEGHAKSIALTDTPPVRANRSVLVTETDDTDSSIFCDLTRSSDTLSIVPKRGDWKIYVEGQRIDSQTLLKPFDIIVIERGKLFRRNLIYLGMQPTILAFVQWRNGNEERMFPRGDLLPLTLSVGLAADRAKELGGDPPVSLTLNIDTELESSLDKVINDYAHQDDWYSGPPAGQTRRLALTVLDAFSGEVLALPSWPFSDLNDTSFDRRHNGANTIVPSRLLNNYNLTNHVVGSTIKPLVFGTLAAQFWPELDVTELVAYNRSDTSDPTAIHPHARLGGIPIDEWDCQSPTPVIDSQSFLTYSLDYFQGVLGMLGTLLDKEDWHRVLVPSNSTPDITLRNRNYIFDLRRVSESPFSLSDPVPRPRPILENTLLFEGLRSLFDVYATRVDGTAPSKQAITFLPSLSGQQSNRNEYLKKVVPDAVVLQSRDFQSVRKNLISFLLGAGSCRWNNIKMAEAGARLITGQRIVAQLERTNEYKGVSTSSPMADEPPPLQQGQWRTNNLVTPMRQAGEVGTASRLRGVITAPYVALYKTGTVEEVDNGRESETLLFIIGQSNNGQFLPGKTLACFFYMQESKGRNEPMKKFDFAKPILRALQSYLERQNGKPQ
jgi:hypothetical protein